MQDFAQVSLCQAGLFPHLFKQCGQIPITVCVLDFHSRNLGEIFLDTKYVSE